jgi:putative DNA primase/helicase
VRLDDQTRIPSWLPDRSQPKIIAFRNTLLDLDTGERLPHTPDWFSSVCLPFDYDPAADCPLFREALNLSLEGDSDRIAVLQEFFGYSLIPTTDAQKALILVGEGGNGKSVTLAALQGMLGDDNVSAVPLEKLGDRFAPALTLGKLVNMVPEVGNMTKTAEGELKAFVSGDPMFFERKNRDPFTARPTARLIISTNNIPPFSDKTDGTWRRLIILPYNFRIPENRREVGMDKAAYWEKAGELPGIFNWSLEGLIRLRANGLRFTESAASQEALEAHRLESDPARQFLQEFYVADPHAGPIPTTALYLQYSQWCELSGHEPLAASRFGKQVRRVFPDAQARQHRFPKDGNYAAGVRRSWVGIRRRHLVDDNPAGLRAYPKGKGQESPGS